MKKIKTFMLKKMLSCDGSPTECMYGPPEWYDEDGRSKGNYLDDNDLQDYDVTESIQDIDVTENIDKPHKETDNDRI